MSRITSLRSHERNLSHIIHKIADLNCLRDTPASGPGVEYMRKVTHTPGGAHSHCPVIVIVRSFELMATGMQARTCKVALPNVPLSLFSSPDYQEQPDSCHMSRVQVYKTSEQNSTSAFCQPETCNRGLKARYTHPPRKEKKEKLTNLLLE